jgi:hypothetical protein
MSLRVTVILMHFSVPTRVIDNQSQPLGAQVTGVRMLTVKCSIGPGP